MTRLLTNEAKNDWQKLMADAEAEGEEWKKKNPKKNRKK